MAYQFTSHTDSSCLVIAGKGETNYNRVRKLLKSKATGDPRCTWTSHSHTISMRCKTRQNKTKTLTLHMLKSLGFAAAQNPFLPKYLYLIITIIIVKNKPSRSNSQWCLKRKKGDSLRNQILVINNILWVKEMNWQNGTALISSLQQQEELNHSHNIFL